ncbi:response regulator transcription factor [Paenibacillus lignilyticus]|uniref:Response regulator transcription factor n=1 Tax=Paenibacillus lignilyticus TaxID=1172615 RepID=A0ABS5CGX5_9BACL|nr:helix-turn-helix domain-containing protein [Paenibacillus lignilyticus]MBP3965075.1 response regulator transcription factor [Paenibacillus lignilyticus]
MYKVLLADDEMLDLEGLERLIPWRELDMEVVASVSNGHEALSWIADNTIDILVSDIKMPHMSGLELSKRALELIPGLKTAFVSGYEDFHYAKQALGLGAFGYVLKPVNDNELIDVLRRIRDTLDAEVKQERLNEAFEDSLPFVRQEKLLQWLANKNNFEAVLPYLDELNTSAEGAEFAVAVLEWDSVLHNFNAGIAHVHSAPQPAKELLLQLCRESGLILLCEASDQRIAVLVPTAVSRSALANIVLMVEKRTAYTITIGLGDSVVAPDIPASFEKALHCLTYKLIVGKNRLISGNDTKPELLESTQDLDLLLSRMFVAVSSYDLVSIDDELNRLVMIVKQLGNRMTVHNFTVHILSRLDNYLTTLNENMQSILGIRFQDYDILYAFETVDDIQSWLRRRLFEISEMLLLKKQKKNRKLIQEIETYVEKNLGDNITLRDAANTFSFSPNYLGHLFKEETGENFSDYVIRRRMEAAKTMLQDPKIKVFEIAHRLGYKNLTYFSRQFRDKFGMTPNEYRRTT